jgi:hypothetical protein
MRALRCLLLLVACGPDPKPVAPTPPSDDRTEGFGGETAPEADGEVQALLAELEGTKDTAARATLHARIGHLYWTRACPEARDGLCVREVKASGARCQTGATLLEARTRGGRDVELATEHLRAAAKPELERPIPDEVGLAHLELADAGFEAMMAVPAPTGLDFSEGKAKASQKKFQSWFQTMVEDGGEVREAYERIIFDLKIPTIGIAAAARIGQLNRWVGDQILGLEVPKDLATQGGDVVAVYCETLAEHAAPLEARAVEAFTVCVENAGKFGVTGEWPALCERELAGQ